MSRMRRIWSWFTAVYVDPFADGYRDMYQSILRQQTDSGDPHEWSHQPSIVVQHPGPPATVARLAVRARTNNWDDDLTDRELALWALNFLAKTAHESGQEIGELIEERRSRA